VIGVTSPRLESGTSLQAYRRGVVPEREPLEARMTTTSTCSFGSYHLTIDTGGVRLEIRTPPEGRDALAAMFGTRCGQLDGSGGSKTTGA
jgi:hypothetical protein